MQFSRENWLFYGLLLKLFSYFWRNVARIIRVGSLIFRTIVMKPKNHPANPCESIHVSNSHQTLVIWGCTFQDPKWGVQASKRPRAAWLQVLCMQPKLCSGTPFKTLNCAPHWFVYLVMDGKKLLIITKEIIY